MRAEGDFVYWQEYSCLAACSHRAVHKLLRDRNFGREQPQSNPPAHLQTFYALEANSMLEREAPLHTRLRKLVLHAFTTRRIKSLAPEIERLCHALLDEIQAPQFDLLQAYATPLPVRIIARLLGVPESAATDLLAWSHAMVGMYQANRTRAMEDEAEAAAKAFQTFLRNYIVKRRRAPKDDLLSHLIKAEEDGERLSENETISTCILLLNAGHEATVHTMGNGVAALLGNNIRRSDAGVVEEVLRYDPPLHLFMRWCHTSTTVFEHRFEPSDQVALLLGSANRDASVFAKADRFDPTRASGSLVSFGGGVHFCLGHALARLELDIGLKVLFDRMPDLRLAGDPHYKLAYHFHGLETLMVSRGF
ncbi:MAG: cytochrome P450 [Pseudomonadota bacterium]